MAGREHKNYTQCVKVLPSRYRPVNNGA